MIDIVLIEITQVERARRAIRVFLLMRRLTLAITGQEETQLPLVRAQNCIKVSDVLDLSTLLHISLFCKLFLLPVIGPFWMSKKSLYLKFFLFFFLFKDNSDLIACTVSVRDGTKARRFLVIDPVQLILVEPDSKRLGWGVATFVGFLQVIFPPSLP